MSGGDYQSWRDFARRVALPYLDGDDADADAAAEVVDRGYLVTCIAVAYLTVERLERGEVAPGMPCAACGNPCEGLSGWWEGDTFRAYCHDAPGEGGRDCYATAPETDHGCDV